jgi:hypothetical protein
MIGTPLNYAFPSARTIENTEMPAQGPRRKPDRKNQVQEKQKAASKGGLLLKKCMASRH